MGNTVWLKQAGVCGGNKVDLNGRTATFDFNNHITNPDIPGKAVTGGYKDRLAEVDYTGHANPKWVIEGWIKSGMDTNSAGSTCITFPRLGSFAMKTGSTAFLFDDDGFMLNPAGSAAVFVSNFKLTKNTSSEKGRQFNLTLFESKEFP